MKIGIFDSGIGGLTVLAELIKKYPNNKYYYFGDNINAPYGTKSKEELLKLSNKIINFLNKKEVDLIIVACGTISSNVFDKLPKDTKIYDVISPTIDYINNSNYENIGLIGTNMTIKSKTFEKRINKKIIARSCNDFVPYIENEQSLTNIIPKYMNIFKDKVDVLILGCTHYPIIEKELNDYLDSKIPLINMGTILADSLKLGNKEKQIRLYFSKVNHTLISNIDKIIKEKYYLEEVVLED
ncbi:MAG: glutamate racemase [Acholeplasma sp.]|nr:glutamate racemase [Acholeplasma sp.]